MLLGVGSEQRAAKERAQQNQINMLGQLLDRPDITLDAKEAIANQLEELTQVSSKGKGMLPLFTRIFHQQQQEKQSRLPQNLFGNLNEQVVTGSMAPATQGVAGQIESNIGGPPMTQRRGSMTSGELADTRAIERYGQQRQILSEVDRQNDERTRQRQLEVQQLRNQGASQRLAATLQNRLIYLDASEQARARREIEQVLAANPAMNEEQAAAQVAQKYENEEQLRKTRVDYTRALLNAIPERLRLEGERVAQGWQRLELDDIRTQVLNEVAKSNADISAFDRETKPLFSELQSVRRQIEYFNKFSDPASLNKLGEMQKFEQDLLNQIWQKKGQYVKPQEPVPQRGSKPSGGGKGAKYVAPKVSQQDLNKVLGLP